MRTTKLRAVSPVAADRVRGGGWLRLEHRIGKSRSHGNASLCSYFYHFSETECVNFQGMHTATIDQIEEEKNKKKN
jgi:hypothetical protein